MFINLIIAIAQTCKLTQCTLPRLFTTVHLLLPQPDYQHGHTLIPGTDQTCFHARSEATSCMSGWSAQQRLVWSKYHNAHLEGEELLGLSQAETQPDNGLQICREQQVAPQAEAQCLAVDGVQIC
jgi:hypothetical protein